MSGLHTNVNSSQYSHMKDFDWGKFDGTLMDLHQRVNLQRRSIHEKLYNRGEVPKIVTLSSAFFMGSLCLFLAATLGLSIAIGMDVGNRTIISIVVGVGGVAASIALGVAVVAGAIWYRLGHHKLTEKELALLKIEWVKQLQSERDSAESLKTQLANKIIEIDEMLPPTE